MLNWLKRLFGKKSETEESAPPAQEWEREAPPEPERPSIARDDGPTVQIPRPSAPERPRNAETTVDVFAPDPPAPPPPAPAPATGLRTAMAMHIGTREYQQDALYVSESHDEPGGYGFAVLCDGMGGMENGEKASAEVVELVVNGIAALPRDAQIPDFFLRTLQEANEKVLSDCSTTGGQGSGTTMVSVVIRDGGMYWAAVGDSRIYIIRHGDMVQITRDHNYAMQLQEQVEAGKLSQTDADKSPMREALVSYIGAPVLEIVDVSRGAFPLVRGDIALLCSDGLTKSLSDRRILELLMGSIHDLDEAARLLPLAAFDEGAGSQDNTSVALLQYIG